MRRIVLLLVLAVVLPPATAAALPRDPLTADQFNAAIAPIAQRLHRTPVTAAPGQRISVAVFDRLAVKQVGLIDLARQIQAEATRAGLAPPSRFGTEVVARALGLRRNLPASDDAGELFPSDTITHAEADYSFNRLRSKSSGSYAYVRGLYDQFTLPAYTPEQQHALHVAVSRIGYPYIWGGESDTTSSKYGPQAHGGYDCSGFVWRVFKLSGDPAGAAMKGRTAAQMAGEIPRSQRIAYADVGPTDLVFFGSPIYHVGIAMSDKFIIQSSNQGVNVGTLFESWRRADFAWARRVL
jgi:cell wall-associated NlpC family hydrolase